MIKCKICEKEYKSYSSLSKHIVYSHNSDITKEEYYNKYINTNFKNICYCGNKTEFISITLGYREYCSCKCTQLDNKTRDKIKQTNIIKYGVDHILKSDVFKNRIKETNLKKYGTEFPQQSKNIKVKIKNTNLKKYGTENVSSNESIKEKRKITNLKKYNNIYFTGSEKFKESMNKSFFTKILNSSRLKNLSKPNFNLDEYNGVIDYKTKYSFNCLQCNNDFYDHLMDGKIPRCPICYPSNESKFEIDFYKWLLPICNTNNILIDKANRTIISPLELDLYFPNNKLALEFNGLYWHSNAKGKDENYHLNKYNKCKEKDIKLIQIFEDEYINKLDIIKSMILNYLNINKSNNYKNLKFNKISKEDAVLFFNTNHLEEFIEGECFGLYKNDILISGIVIKDNNIIRYCNLLNNNDNYINLFIKHIKEQKLYNKLNYISDNRYDINLDCHILNITKPKCYYIKRNVRLSEDRENLNRIWDCGKTIYEIM